MKEIPFCQVLSPRGLGVYEIRGLVRTNILQAMIVMFKVVDIEETSLKYPLVHLCQGSVPSSENRHSEVRGNGIRAFAQNQPVVVRKTRTKIPVSTSISPPSES